MADLRSVVERDARPPTINSYHQFLPSIPTINSYHQFLPSIPNSQFLTPNSFNFYSSPFGNKK